MWFCVFNGVFGCRLDKKQPYKSREEAVRYAEAIMLTGEISSYEIVEH